MSLSKINEGCVRMVCATENGICVGMRKDRGQGLFLSVMSAETRAILYVVRVRNTNARGIDRLPVRYSLTTENRDIILEFS